MKKILLAGLVFGLAGCVVPAKEYKFDNSRTYTQSYDAVWENLTKFYATNNISIQTIEKDSGIIAAESLSVDGSYLSCPNYGAMVIPLSVVKLNTFVEKTTPVKVTVNTNFGQRYGANPNAIPCNSTGKLERKILDYLGN